VPVEPKTVCAEVLVAKQMAMEIACQGGFLSRPAAAALGCPFMDLMRCTYISCYSHLNSLNFFG